MRNRFIPISRRRERIYWKPATNFLQRRHCGSSTSCSAMSFENMREQPVTYQLPGVTRGMKGVWSRACRRRETSFTIWLVVFSYIIFWPVFKYQRCSCGRLCLNNRKILRSGRNTRAPRTATTWLTEWMNRSGKFKWDMRMRNTISRL